MKFSRVCIGVVVVGQSGVGRALVCPHTILHLWSQLLSHFLCCGNKTEMKCVIYMKCCCTRYYILLRYSCVMRNPNDHNVLSDFYILS